MAAKRHARAAKAAGRPRSAPRLVGGALLAVAIVVGAAWTLWPRPSAAPPARHQPTLAVPYHELATILARARAAHLIAGHAGWFVRVRHGRIEVVVQDAATHGERVFALTIKEQHR